MTRFPASSWGGSAARWLLLIRMSHTGIDITAELVRNLLREQHPDLADYPVRLGARGWDNQLWRLGDDLAVRLPWATGSADALLRKEHTWLPALAPRLPLPVPVPQRIGEPSERFPRPDRMSPKISCSHPNEGPCAILAMPASNYSGHSTASESREYPRTPMRRARQSARIWTKTPMAGNPISASRPPNSATPKR